MRDPWTFIYDTWYATVWSWSTDQTLDLEYRPQTDTLCIEFRHWGERALDGDAIHRLTGALDALSRFRKKEGKP